MLNLSLAAIFFVGVHLFISGTRLRDTLVARVGGKGYQIGFSIASLVGIVWLVIAYQNAPLIQLWYGIPGIRWLGLAVTLVAFVLLALAVTTKNPTAIGQEGTLDQAEPARGVVRVTRHPLMWGIAGWSAIHMLMTGDLASQVLFGAFLITALAGTASIDAKRKRAFGERWDTFARQTSNVPFLAIVSGRNSLRLGEIGLVGPLLGVALFAVFLWSHAWLFGETPLPNSLIR